MNMTDVVDLTADPELVWVGEILAKAKQIMEEHEGSLEPMLFMETPEGRAIFPVTQVGDINGDSVEKNRIASVLHEVAAEMKASQLVFLSDTFVRTVIDPEAKAALAADPGAGHRWPREYLDKVCHKREAIIASVEFDKTRRRFFAQFYSRKEGNVIVFEECVDADDSEGRFVGLLADPAPIDDRDVTEDEAKALRAVMKLRPPGYRAEVGADTIRLFRHDGSVWLAFHRRQGPKRFATLRRALIEGGWADT
jgi:hypothetical protein